MASLGLPVDEFLALKDPFLINLYVTIANRVVQLRKQDHEDLATAIANAVAKSIKTK